MIATYFCSFSKQKIRVDFKNLRNTEFILPFKKDGIKINYDRIVQYGLFRLIPKKPKFASFRLLSRQVDTRNM